MKTPPDQPQIQPGGRKEAEPPHGDLIERICKTIRRKPLIIALLLSALGHTPLDPSISAMSPSSSIRQTTTDDSEKKQKRHADQEDESKTKEKKLQKDKENAEKQKGPKAHKEIEDSEDDGYIPVQTLEEREMMLDKVDKRLSRINHQKLDQYKKAMLQRIEAGEYIPLKQLVFDLEELSGVEKEEVEKAKQKHAEAVKNLIEKIPMEGLTTEFLNEFVEEFFQTHLHQWGQGSITDCNNTNLCNCFAREVEQHMLLEEARMYLAKEKTANMVQGNLYEKQHTIPVIWEVDTQGKVIKTLVLQPPMQTIKKAQNEEGTAYIDLEKFKCSLLGKKYRIGVKGKDIKKSSRIISENNQPLQPEIEIAGRLRGSKFAINLATQTRAEQQRIGENKEELGVIELTSIDPGPTEARKRVLRGMYGITVDDYFQSPIVDASAFISPSVQTVEGFLKKDGDQNVNNIKLGDVSLWSHEALERLFKSQKKVKTTIGGQSFDYDETYRSIEMSTDLHRKLPENFKKIWRDGDIPPITLKVINTDKNGNRMPIEDLRFLLEGGTKKYGRFFDFDYQTLTANEARTIADVIRSNFNKKPYYFDLPKMVDLDDEVLSILLGLIENNLNLYFKIPTDTFFKIAQRNTRILNQDQIFPNEKEKFGATLKFSGEDDEVELCGLSAKLFILHLKNGTSQNSSIPQDYYLTLKNKGEAKAKNAYRKLLTTAITEMDEKLNIDDVLKKLAELAMTSPYALMDKSHHH